MATEEQYLDAGRRAHAKGDKEAASYFASKIKEMRSAQKAPPSTEDQSIQAPTTGSLTNGAMNVVSRGLAAAGEFLSGKSKYERPQTPEEEPMSSAEYFSAVLQPLYESERAGEASFGDVRSAEFIHQAKKDEEAAEFEELYPRGTIRELDPTRLKDAPFGERVSVGLRQLGIPDEAERAQSLEKMGYKTDTIAGREVVKDPRSEEVFVLNYPRLSGQDITSFFSETAQATPAGMYMAGARGGLSVLGRGLLAGGLTAAAQQTGQAALGGDFDWLDVAIDTGFGIAGEGVSRVIGNKIKALSPAKQQEVARSENIMETMEVLGINERDLKRLVQESATSIPEKKRMLAQAEQGLNLAKLQAATKGRPDKALTIEDMVDADNAAHLSQIQHTLDPSTANSRRAMSEVRAASKKLRDTRLDRVSGMTSKLYDDAFEGIDNVDVTDLRASLVEISKLTNPSSPEGAKIDSFIRQLAPEADAPVVLNASGREILDLKKDPRLVQNVVKSMRRIINSSGDANVVEATKKAFNEVFPTLNARTGGKLAHADKRYAQSMLAKENFIKSHFGKGAEMADHTWGEFQEALFNPKASKFASDKFMKDLRASNPEAARKLWGSYWNSKVAGLPAKPKPSDIRKALFDGPNHPADYAPNPIAKRAIRDLEKLVRANESIEGITLNKAATEWAEGRMDPEVAHWVYLRMGLFRALKGKKDADLARVWLAAAGDENWAKEIAKLSDTRAIKAVGRQVDAKKALEKANTTAKKAEAMFKKFLADSNLDSPSAGYLTSQAAPEIAPDAAETPEQKEQFERASQNIQDFDF